MERATLSNTTCKRTATWGLGVGNELAAAKRVDAGERIMGGEAHSLPAFTWNMQTADEAAGGAPEATIASWSAGGQEKRSVGLEYSSKVCSCAEALHKACLPLNLASLLR